MWWWCDYGWIHVAWSLAYWSCLYFTQTLLSKWHGCFPISFQAAMMQMYLGCLHEHTITTQTLARGWLSESARQSKTKWGPKILHSYHIFLLIFIFRKFKRFFFFFLIVRVWNSKVCVKIPFNSPPNIQHLPRKVKCHFWDFIVTLKKEKRSSWNAFWVVHIKMCEVSIVEVIQVLRLKKASCYVEVRINTLSGAGMLI